MILVLKEQIKKEAVNELMARLTWMNLHGVATEKEGRTCVAIVSGEDTQTDLQQFLALPQVEKVIPFTQKFKLAGSEFKKGRTPIQVQHQTIGDGTLTVIAGPCAIETEEQIHRIAELVKAAGATILRGGAFKPRTSPYDFQGLGRVGLQFMQSAAKQHGLLSISELMDAQDLDLLLEYVDILQIGARNMQNFSLLKQVGKTNKPVMLKRGLSATYMDFLMAAEYILQAGNPNVILCERGIRTFETYARNTLDLAAVPILQELSHLPVMVDPSHGTGLRRVVPKMAYAAVAAGADGIMVEVHTHPDQSISDAKQAISPEVFAKMMKQLPLIAAALQASE